MTTVHSDKENVFRGPRTPLHKTRAGTSFATPANNDTQRAFAGKQALKTPAARVPLGGKDHNAHRHGAGASATGKPKEKLAGPLNTRTPGLHRSLRKSADRHRPTLSSPELGNDLDLNGDLTTAPFIGPQLDYGYVEVETIPDAPPPLRDVPLYHVDLDYDAIAKAIRTPGGFSESDDELPGLSVANLRDFDVFEAPEPAPVRPTIKQPAKRGLSAKPKSATNQLPRRLPDYMAPTKSAQAKARAPVSPATVRRHASPAQPKPPFIDIDVSLDNLIDF